MASERFQQAKTEAFKQRWEAGPHAGITALTSSIEAETKAEYRAYLLWLRGVYRRTLGELDAAIGDFTIAIDLIHAAQPSPLISMVTQAARIATGKTAPKFDRHLMPDPLRAAFFWRGNCRALQASTADALTDYRAFLDVPEIPYLGSGSDYYDDLVFARQDVERVMAAEPDHPLPVFCPGIINEALHDWQAAIDDLRRARELAPSDDKRLHDMAEYWGGHCQREMGFAKQYPQYVSMYDFARMEPGTEYCKLEQLRPRTDCTVTFYSLRRRDAPVHCRNATQAHADLQAADWQLASRYVYRDGTIFTYTRARD